MSIPTKKPPVGPAFSVAPSGWGATVDYDAWTDRWQPKERIIIHYGGGANAAGSAPFSQAKEKTVLKSWEHYHISGQGWRGLAYSYAIGQTGTIYRARGWNLNGAQVGDYDNDGIKENDESIAVVFILGGNQNPSFASWDAFAKLRSYLEKTMTVGMPLLGHQEVQKYPSTACPGTFLMAYIKDHRNSGDVPLPKWPTLIKPGDTGPAIWGTREILRMLGFAPKKTHTYGTILVEQVKKYQSARGLTADGVVGPQTRGAFIVDLENLLK